MLRKQHAMPEQAAKEKLRRELKSSHRDFLRLGHDRAKAHARESARKQKNYVIPQGIRCTAVTINPYGTNDVTQRQHQQIIKQSAFVPKGSNFYPSLPDPIAELTREAASKCMSNDSNHKSCTTNQGVADSTPLGVSERQRPTDKRVILQTSGSVWKGYLPAGPGAHMSPLSACQGGADSDCTEPTHIDYPAHASNWLVRDNKYTVLTAYAHRLVSGCELC